MGKRRENFALADLLGMDHARAEESPQQILIPHNDELKEKFGYLVSFLAPGTAWVRRPQGSKAEVLYTKSA